MKKTIVCRIALAMILIMCFASVTVFAADTEYAPSIEAAAVPEILPPSEDKPEVGAVINKPDGSTEDIVLEDILNVSYEEAKDLIADDKTSAEHKAICERFVAAYDSLKKSGGVKESVKDIDRFVEDNLKIKYPKYVVYNVFELNIGGHGTKLEGGAKVTVRFDNSQTKAKADKFVVVHMVGDEWKIVPYADVKVTDDYIEVAFDELCPVAFLNVSQGEAPDTSDADEGNNVITTVIIILSITAVIVAAIVVFFVLEKKGVIAKLAKGAKKE